MFEISNPRLARQFCFDCEIDFVAILSSGEILGIPGHLTRDFFHSIMSHCKTDKLAAILYNKEGNVIYKFCL